MKRLAAIVCATTLSVAALSACGSDDGDSDDSSNTSDSSDSSGSDDSDTDDSDGDDSDEAGGDYCSRVENFKTSFGDISGSEASIDDFSAVSDAVGETADAAPDDISSSWDSLESALEDVADKLEDSGLPTDQPLSQVIKKDKQAAQELMGAMSGLQSMQTDGEAIEKNVKEECDIDMAEATQQ